MQCHGGTHVCNAKRSSKYCDGFDMALDICTATCARLFGGETCKTLHAGLQKSGLSTALGAIDYHTFRIKIPQQAFALAFLLVLAWRWM